MNKTFLLRPHIKHLGGVIRFVQNQPWIRIQVNFIVDPRTSVADPDPVIQDQIRELDRTGSTPALHRAPTRSGSPSTGCTQW